MKTKFTPGPWKINTEAPCEILANDGYRDRVALINPDLGNSNWMQDATLIAAAPELLSTLETVWAAIENGSLDKKFFELRALYKNTLNKAKGE